MTTATITGPARLPGGGANFAVLPNRRFVFSLVTAPGRAAHSSTGEIYGSGAVTSDSQGQFSIELDLNTEIDPKPVLTNGVWTGGTFYEVYAAGTDVKWQVQLTAAGTFEIGDPTIQVASPVPPGFVAIQGPPGPPLDIAGHVANEAALPSSGGPGALWITDDTGHAWSWITTGTPHWFDTGEIVGPAGPGVPAGGTTGQVLDKASGTDFATQWHTLTAGDVGAASATDSRFPAVPPRPPINEQAFVTPGTATWTAPTAPAGCAPYTRCHVLSFTGGAGGGSGRRGAAGTVRCGGGGGGGGAHGDVEFDISVAGSSQTVTVGAGGAGGAAVTVNDTDGNPGTVGSDSSFGVLAGAWNGTNETAGAGGTATGAAAGLPSIVPNSGGAGGAGDGAGGAGIWSAGVGYGGNTGGGGGGGGGGVTSADVASQGGAGLMYGQDGGLYTFSALGGVPGGAGGAGRSATAAYPRGGIGGGGGAGSITGAAGAGGNGGTFGGAGGGGGASLNGNASGAGGAGAPGCVIVICT